jgi:murein DD-endopeptidase MepM/ murein hydrolase activator NlpD
VRLVAAALLAVVAQAANADALELRGDWKQGHLVFGRVTPGSEVSFNGRKLSVSSKGDFVLGLDRDQKPDAEIVVRLPTGTQEKHHYEVATQEWQVQRIEGLPPAKVNPPGKEMPRIKKEQAQIHAAHGIDSELDGFRQSWIWPAQGRISGVFGSQRILNGEAKAPHAGVDVAVPIGTKVVAPADGVVRLAGKNFYFTGGTLIIDHGHGVSSIMVHLSKLIAKKGDPVKQGQLVALSGMTGRATGPHLHWGVNWFDTKVDAATLVPPMPESATSSEKP